MATVRVSNFPTETSEADILDLFSAYGSIQHLALFSAEPHLGVEGHGYFDLSSADVERAVAELNGHLFKGSAISVSQVPQRPPAREVAQDPSAGLKPQPNDETPTLRFGSRYVVTSVELAVGPEGGQGGDWYRYVLSCGRSEMAGLHRGTLEEVTEYAASCAELVNSRNVTGKSGRASAYTTKKGG